MKKADFENNLKDDTKDILRKLKGYIKHHYGDRCKTQGCGCIVCQIWCIYDLFLLHSLN